MTPNKDNQIYFDKNQPKQKNWGQDLHTHYLLEIREPPPSLIALRSELASPENKDIYDAAIKETTFEAVLGTIASKLDIALDGLYDVPDLCDLLANVLRNRNMPGTSNQPHLRDRRLLNVEMVEKDKDVELVRVSDLGPGTLVGEKENKVIEDTGAETPIPCDICIDYQSCILEGNCTYYGKTLLTEFDKECIKWRGKKLIGKYAHWCDEWDSLPVDETTSEFSCCVCNIQFEDGTVSRFSEDIPRQLLANNLNEKQQSIVDMSWSPDFDCGSCDISFKCKERDMCIRLLGTIIGKEVSVAKQVDATDLKSVPEKDTGSSPVAHTTSQESTWTIEYCKDCTDREACEYIGFCINN